MAGGGRNQRGAQRQSGSAQPNAQIHSHAPSLVSTTGAPPLPPPLPPSPALQLEDIANEPVRIYPFDRASVAARASSSAASMAAAAPLSTSARLLQVLQNIHKSAVVVGILAGDASSSTGVYTFANRLIGRVAFMENYSTRDSALCPKSSLSASIQLFYDESRSIVYLLGVSKPENDFLATLSDGNDDQNTDLGDEIAKFQAEKRKMELVMHSCSHLLFNFHERGQFTTNLLKNIRALASDKQSLIAQLSSSASSGGKPPKRGHDKSSGNGSHATVNVLAPGRCVPLAMFIVPARDEILNATHRPTTTTSLSSSLKSRSSTVAFCKAHEAMLCSLFRSLRGGLVGSLRTRDAISPANLSKERRLFQVDPVHCVAVLSTASASSAGGLDHRFESVLASLSWDFLSSSDSVDLDTVLQPLEQDDVGFPHAIQHLNRCVELLQNVSSSSGSSFSSASSGGGGKDGSSGVRMDLLTVAQWLKSFQSLLKTMHRAELKKKQDHADAMEQRESMRLQFDHMDVRL